MRIGGDEFAVVLRDPTESADHLVARIESAISWSWVHDGALIEVGASVGASVMPSDAATLERLFSTADHAMYARKAVHHGAANPG